MALRLENDFVVAASVPEVWSTLLDLERVAGCLPGATIEATDEPDTFLGSMRVKLGPVTMDYKGRATLGTVDEAARTAVFSVQGKETRGGGTASATITNRLHEEGDSTRVVVETELSVTGRAAQFGRGIMQDVAAAMLGDFSARLSELIASAGANGDAASGAEAAETRPVPPAAREPEALAVGGLVRRALVRRLRGLFAPLRRR